MHVIKVWPVLVGRNNAQVVSVYLPSRLVAAKRIHDGID